MKHKLGNILYHFPIVSVLILSLLLLTFIGYGEAKRKYSLFAFEKLITQAEIIHISVNQYLLANLSLELFDQFETQSNALLQSDPSLEKIIIVDAEFNILFFNLQKKQLKGLEISSHSQKILKQLARSDTREIYSLQQLDAVVGGEGFLTNSRSLAKMGLKIEASDSRFRASLALMDKSELVGYVIVDAEQKRVFNFLEQKFENVFYWLIALSLGFIAFIAFWEFFFPQRGYRKKILEWGYFLCFIAMSSVIAVSVFQIYDHAVLANSKVLSGLIKQTINDDARQTSFFNSGTIIIAESHATPNKAVSTVKAWDETTGQENTNLSISADFTSKAFLSSAKTFIVLLMACGLISLVFVDACTALMVIDNDNGKKNQDKGSDKTINVDSSFLVGLNLVKPAYFLIVFVNALSLSFLPQLIGDFAQNSGVSWASASLPFTLFYICFAAVLIPAGQYAERGDLKKLMAFGLAAEVIGLSLVAATTYSWSGLYTYLDISAETGFFIKEEVLDYVLFILGRSASGVGQGLFLIGLQSYILSITPKNKQTQGAAVKVNGRNAGLIAGTAIGALLYSHMNYSGIFIMASVLSMIAMLYLWRLVPGVDSIKAHHKSDLLLVTSAKKISISANVLHCLKDVEFMKVLLLVGLTGKIAISGVFMFAVPLLLAKKGFSMEDIGQFLMIFYISSMAVTHRSARMVDDLGRTKRVMSGSAVIGGFSIAFLGAIGVTEWAAEGLMTPGIEYLADWVVSFNQHINAWEIANIQTYLIIVCLLLAGASNGLLAAPVLTHINKTDVALKYGHKSITATYIFLERGGHVIGPVFISYILLVGGQSSLALSFFGVMMIFFGVIYQLSAKII